MPSEQPELTAIMATGKGWPHIRACFEALLAAAQGHAVEVILGDGSRAPAPTPEELGTGTVYLKRPGATTFQLRAEAYRIARGAIVATTEDHCHVAPDWCAQTLRAHREHPKVAVIGGAVANAATQTAADRASYLAIQTSVMPPVDDGAEGPIAQANHSYKREALQGIKRTAEGINDYLHQAFLRERGAGTRVDSRVLVDHDQHLSFLEASALHFNAGRSGASFVRSSEGSRRWLRVMAASIAPWARTVRALSVALRKGARPGDLARDAAMVAWLYQCQAAGQAVGTVLGPGDSHRHMG